MATLSREIKARKMESKGPGEGRFNGTQESIYVGTGEVRVGTSLDVIYKFTVPEAVRERAVPTSRV